MNSAEFSTFRIILYKRQDHFTNLTESGSLELLLNAMASTFFHQDDVQRQMSHQIKS